MLNTAVIGMKKTLMIQQKFWRKIEKRKMIIPKNVCIKTTAVAHASISSFLLFVFNNDLRKSFVEYSANRVPDTGMVQRRLHVLSDSYFTEKNKCNRLDTSNALSIDFVQKSKKAKPYQTILSLFLLEVIFFLIHAQYSLS